LGIGESDYQPAGVRHVPQADPRQFGGGPLGIRFVSQAAQGTSRDSSVSAMQLRPHQGFDVD
jgi:hypothetical protein